MTDDYDDDDDDYDDYDDDVTKTGGKKEKIRNKWERINELSLIKWRDRNFTHKNNKR